MFKVGVRGNNSIQILMEESHSDQVSVMALVSCYSETACAARVRSVRLCF